MAIERILVEHRAEVLSRWADQVRSTVSHAQLPTLELLDHMPQFIDEIAAALRAAAGVSTSVPTPDKSETATAHGVHRLRLGFSLDAVVSEYGVLKNVIVATAEAHGEPITFEEMQVVFDCLLLGIARAVSKYVREKDADVLRHASEHFSFVAHELRGPLSTAAMAFRQLRMTAQLPTENRVVDGLALGLQRTSELIDQSLQASGATEVELHRQRTTLAALLEDVEIGTLAVADAKKVTVRVACHAELRLHVDVRLLRAAIAHLLRNAVKFSAPGSTVELRGRVVEERAVIEVEDSCGGLEPGKVEAALAPFVRLNERQSAFGLGLAIAKQAVHAHAGSLRVENLPGKGCVFVLELPILPADGAEE